MAVCPFGRGLRGVAMGRQRWLGTLLSLAVGMSVAAGLPCSAQENPLGDAHTKAPPPPTVPKDDRPVVTGADVAGKATTVPNAKIRVDVDLVLIPVTVTDP